MADLLIELRVSPALRERVAAMLRISDGVACDQLDEEYRDLARALVGELARKRPSPLARGDEPVGAGTGLYALGQINYLFDPRSDPHLTGDALATALGVPAGE